eukprot:3427606-Prymnesium_polylepis.2
MSSHETARIVHSVCVTNLISHVKLKLVCPYHISRQQTQTLLDVTFGSYVHSKTFRLWDIPTYQKQASKKVTAQPCASSSSSSSSSSSQPESSTNWLRGRLFPTEERRLGS